MGWEEKWLLPKIHPTEMPRPVFSIGCWPRVLCPFPAPSVVTELLSPVAGKQSFPALAGWSKPEHPVCPTFEHDAGSDAPSVYPGALTPAAPDGVGHCAAPGIPSATGCARRPPAPAVSYPHDLVVIRQNFSFRKQSFLAAAAQAHSRSEERSHGLPPVVWLLRFLPALRLFPGQTPAHELISLSDGNWVMSGPVSARIFAALRSCIPGMVCRSCHC